jgi:hypothetical protein
MAEVAAIAVAKIEGSMTTDDGKTFLLKGTQPDGNNVVVAFPSEELTALVGMAALGREQSLRIQGADTDFREVFATSWFELSKDQVSATVILSLTFASGGRLHFSLPGSMPQQMLETLQQMTGAPTPPPPGTLLS